MDRAHYRYLVYGFSLLAYGRLLYATPRTEFPALLGLFALLYAGYFLLMGSSLYRVAERPKLGREALFMGILYRILACSALPLLSDDYFRFIWDGRLLAQGLNPYALRPEELLSALPAGLTQELFARLNSPTYYTIYPPLNQGIFALAAWLSPTSEYGAVLLMKAFLLGAELGTLFLLRALLRQWGLPRHWLGFYALNPLIIVEICGNLHFEGLMIFFLLLSIYALQQQRLRWAAVAFSFSVGAKFLPLMFLPLLIRRLGWLQAILFGTIVLGLNAVAFLPFVEAGLQSKLGSSLGLYFRSFEFNASLYYVARWLGYQWMGYNVIHIAGRQLAALSFLLIWLITIFERKVTLGKLPLSMLAVLCVYLSFTVSVHPWYLSMAVALCVLTPFRFPLIWSALIPLTYSAYAPAQYRENLGLVAVEYSLVLLALTLDLWRYYRKDLALRTGISTENS